MTSFLQLALALVVIILAAKLAGALTASINLPSVLGELCAGVVLGPTVLNLLGLPIFNQPQLEEIITDLAELGVIFIMFLAGLESDVRSLRESGKAAALAGTLGVIAPLLLGFLVSLRFGYQTVTALFIGVILTATSVSITAETLRDLGKLRSRVGSTLLGAAVFDDILGLLVLSLFLTLVANGGSPSPEGFAFTVGRMIVFLLAAAMLGIWALPLLTRTIHKRSNPSRARSSQFVLSIAIVVGLGLALASEVVGALAGITGAYLAGLFFSRTELRPIIQESMQGLVYGFFAPIFFISIGLRANARILTNETLIFAAVIVVVAIVTKIVGCGFGAKLGGMRNREALQVGVGMISRGEVGLIVASIGIDMHIIGQDVYATTVVVVLVSTLVTPLFLSLAFRGESRPEGIEEPGPQTESG